jgi:hypothetical protein
MSLDSRLDEALEKSSSHNLNLARLPHGFPYFTLGAKHIGRSMEYTVRGG